MEQQPTPIWLLGSWTILPDQNRLQGPQKEFFIKPRLMRLFHCLIVHQGQIIEKEKLIKQVWPDQIISDNLLTKTVSELRKILQEHFDYDLQIDTIRSVGYRLRSKETIYSNQTTDQTSKLAIALNTMGQEKNIKKQQRLNRTYLLIIGILLTALLRCMFADQADFPMVIDQTTIELKKPSHLGYSQE